MIQPPSTGPTIGAKITAIATSENPFARCDGSNVSRITDCWDGCSPPPNSPCSSRNTTSCGRLVAMPHRNEHTVNIAMQIRKYRLRPISRPSQPATGTTMPFATRYDVSVQVASSLLADSAPAMFGRLTLTIVVSRISMNGASVAAPATSQTFPRGRHAASCHSLMRRALGLSGTPHRRDAPWARRRGRGEAAGRDPCRRRSGSSPGCAGRSSRSYRWRSQAGTR